MQQRAVHSITSNISTTIDWLSAAADDDTLRPISAGSEHISQPETGSTWLLSAGRHSGTLNCNKVTNYSVYRAYESMNKSTVSMTLHCLKKRVNFGDLYFQEGGKLC